jgi:thioredoxin-dependent peroxiredoxin
MPQSAIAGHLMDYRARNKGRIMKEIETGKMNAFWIFIVCLGLASQPVFADSTSFLPERDGVTRMKGVPVTLVGPEIVPGQKAPDFTAQAIDLRDVRFSDLDGKVKLIASVPSLDTPVCRTEIHRFNEDAVAVSPKIAIFFISMDLPFAQKRFCGADGIRGVRTFSDHRTAEFGEKYGVLIKEMRLLSRALFIVDPQGFVRYAEYVKENATEPDYKKALKALKEIADRTAEIPLRKTNKPISST